MSNELMLPGTAAFHITMLALNVVTLRSLRRKQSHSHLWKAAILWFIILLALAILYGENGFGHMRLVAYGIFLHGILMSAFAGAIFKTAAPRISIALWITSASLAVIAWYSFYIEPYRLEVARSALVIGIFNPERRA